MSDIPWFKVDDGFYDNPKVKSIPRRDRMACLGLWVTAGTWSAKHLTDGRVPSYMLEEFGAELSHGDTLVSSGLWRADGDAYVFHDWHDWQPTRVATLASREKERLRKEAYRAKKAGNTGESPAGTQTDGANASQDPDPTRPDPTRPSSSTKKSGAAKRGSRIPEPFMLTAEMREWAKAEVPTVDAEAATKKFVDYWRAESGAKASKIDWVATWRNWMRRQLEFQKESRNRPAADPDKWMNQ